MAIVLSLVIAFALNGAFSAVAAARRTDVVTDLSYTLTFASLAVVLPFHGRARDRAARGLTARRPLGRRGWARTCSAASCG